MSDLIEDKQAEISYEASPDITDDASVPYGNWKEYETAVKEGEEEVPVATKVKARGNVAKKWDFNVDKALDAIDLTFPNYTPSAQAHEFFNTIRLVMGEDFEHSSSIMQYFLVDLIFDNVTREMFPYSPEINSRIRLNKKMVAIIASRFSAKSTIITAFMPIYVAITGKLPGFGKVMFWVSFGDSQQAGAKVQANTIRDICEDSLFCKDYFEKMRFTDEECEFLRKGDGKVKDRAFMFKVKGAAGGSVRGIRYKTARPQIFTFDDIIKSEADANSAIIMTKLRSMIYSDASKALGKTGKIIIVNTPFNKKDPVYSALENGVWTPLAIPICEKISMDITKEEYVGSWEAMKSYEEVMEDYENAHYGETVREFNQEYMLRISSEEDRMIPDHLIQWFDRTLTMKALQNYSLYITTDFTTTTNSLKDFSALGVWAVSSEGDWLLMDLCVKRQGIIEQYDELFRMIRTWSGKGATLEVGVEVDGQQRSHIHSLRLEMNKRNLYFTFARQRGAKFGFEGVLSKNQGNDKHSRFRMVLPQFQNKKIYFAEQLKGTPDMDEALLQLVYTTHFGFGSGHDDFNDIVSMMGAIDIVLPLMDDFSTNPPNGRQDSIWDDIYEDEGSAYDSYS